MARRPTSGELVEWREDRFPPAETRRIGAAAAGSALPEAAGLLREIDCLAVDLLLAGPPPALRQKLEALFTAQRRADGHNWRFLDAELASKEDEDGEPCYTFTTAVAEITLTVRRRDARFDLHGAILAHGEETATYAVELQQHGRTLRLQASERWGDFVFARLPEGSYRLVIAGEDAELTIPHLVLGAA